MHTHEVSLSAERIADERRTMSAGGASGGIPVRAGDGHEARGGLRRC